MRTRLVACLLILSLLCGSLFSPWSTPSAQAASSPTPPTGWVFAATFQKVPLTLAGVTYYAYELKKSTASAASGWLVTKADGTIISDPANYQKLALTATVSKMVQDSAFLPQMKNELEALKGIRWRIELCETATLLTKLAAGIAATLIGNTTTASGVLETAVTALVPAGAKIMEQNKIHDALWSLFTGNVINSLTPSLTKALEIVGKLTTSDSEKWLKISGVVSTVLRRVIAQFAEGGAATYQKAFTLANTPRSSWSYEDASLFLKEYEEGRTHGLPFAKWYISLIPHEGGLVGSVKNVGTMWWESIIKEAAGPGAQDAMTAIDATVFAKNIVQECLKSTLFTTDITADIQSADAIFAVYRLTYDPSIAGSLADQSVTMVTPIATTTDKTLYAVGNSVTASDVLRVRKQPSLTGAQSGTVQKGATGTIMGASTVAEGYRWWPVRWSSGLTGWCAGAYLRRASAGTGTGAASLIPYRKGGKWGFCDRNLTMVIPATYDYAWPFADGLAKVQVYGYEGFSDSKYGYINASETMVIQPVYEYARSFREGLASVYVDGKWGFVDTKGTMVIPATYDDASPFDGGLAAVEVGSKWGFINTKGTTVIQAMFERAGPFTEGLASVQLNGKWGFIDPRGSMVIPAVYDGAWPFSEGLAAVKVSTKWGYIDTKGTMVIQPKYDQQPQEEGGYSAEYYGSFHDGLAPVYVNGKWGYIDATGKLVLPAIYYWGRDFSEGLAGVYLPGGNGYIDTKGTVVIPAAFYDVDSFHDGIAAVRPPPGYEWSFIDAKGTQYWED
jgi:hypothetical protein